MATEWKSKCSLWLIDERCGANRLAWGGGTDALKQRHANSHREHTQIHTSTTSIISHLCLFVTEAWLTHGHKPSVVLGLERQMKRLIRMTKFCLLAANKQTNHRHDRSQSSGCGPNESTHTSQPSLWLTQLVSKSKATAGQEIEHNILTTRTLFYIIWSAPYEASLFLKPDFQAKSPRCFGLSLQMHLLSFPFG